MFLLISDNRWPEPDAHFDFVCMVFDSHSDLILNLIVCSLLSILLIKQK